MPAGGDGACDDPLPFAKALHLCAQFLDDADRLMPDRQAGGDRVLTAQDVHVGTADRGGGDTNQGVARADFRNRLVFQDNPVFFDEYRSFHAGHGTASTRGNPGRVAACVSLSPIAGLTQSLGKG
ncbi:hypothetical protein D3C76_329790 [compost metagenome]